MTPGRLGVMTQNDRRDALHAFETYDGASGRTCTRMVIEDGDGVECGLSPGHPTHDVGPCNEGGFAYEAAARIARAEVATDAVDLVDTCRHDSASGIDTTPFGPDKVWRCDHCGLRWVQGAIDAGH